MHDVAGGRFGGLGGEHRSLSPASSPSTPAGPPPTPRRPSPFPLSSLHPPAALSFLLSRPFSLLRFARPPSRLGVTTPPVFFFFFFLFFLSLYFSFRRARAFSFSPVSPFRTASGSFLSLSPLTASCTTQQPTPTPKTTKLRRLSSFFTVSRVSSRFFVRRAGSPDRLTRRDETSIRYFSACLKSSLRRKRKRRSGKEKETERKRSH